MNKKIRSTSSEQQRISEELDLVRSKLEDTSRQLDEFSDKGVCNARCRNYAYIVENSPVVVVITTANGLIEFVNPKFEEVTGYRSDEVIGKNPNILKSGETPAEEYAKLWKSIRSGKQWTGVFHNRRKNGELFWERAVISGITNEAGKIPHFIAIKEDITAIKEAEEKLEQEQLKIIQQSKMAEIGLLASGVMHEVGNPIAAIRGLLCDIKDSCQEFDDHEALHRMVEQQLDIILAEVDRITGITMDISEFAYSRYTEPELLDVNNVINTTCRLVQYDKRWQCIDLKVILEPELPAICAYKDQLTQVIINLLSNAAYAVEHVDSRPSAVHISTFHNDDVVTLMIKDNGCGIEDSKLARIFDTFFTDKEPGEGTGLGLALCKNIIDNHDGKIEIFSKVNMGTEVHVMLPIRDCQAS